MSGHLLVFLLVSFREVFQSQYCMHLLILSCMLHVALISLSQLSRENMKLIGMQLSVLFLGERAVCLTSATLCFLAFSADTWVRSYTSYPHKTTSFIHTRCFYFIMWMRRLEFQNWMISVCCFYLLNSSWISYLPSLLRNLCTPSFMLFTNFKFIAA
jgi:hypothetical protein